MIFKFFISENEALLGQDLRSKTIRSAAKDLCLVSYIATKEAFQSAKEYIGKHKKASVILGMGLAVGVLAVIVAPLVISAVGFTTEGVASGSWAASWQASIGNVEAETLFAFLQSAGINGLSSGIKAALGFVFGGFGALVGHFFVSKGKEDANDSVVKEKDVETDEVNDDEDEHCVSSCIFETSYPDNENQLWT